MHYLNTAIAKSGSFLQHRWDDIRQAMNVSWEVMDKLLYRSLDVVSASITSNVPFFESANLNAQTLHFMDKYRDNVTGIMRKVTKLKIKR